MKTTYFEEYASDAARETLDRTMTDVAIVILPEQTGDFFPHPADAEWATRNELGASRTAH